MGDVAIMLAVFAFSFCVGYVLILRVPQMLHSPLMSMTNAVSGVTLVGAVLLFTVSASPTAWVLGTLAVALATFNVVGGFSITDRMLSFFKKRESKE